MISETTVTLVDLKDKRMKEEKMESPSVALVSGFWGQNIGNAFFNVGGKRILEKVFGDERVAYIQDQPGYWTFNNQKKGNPTEDVALLSSLDVDWIVLQGPMLSSIFRPIWEETFRRLREKNTRILLLSAAFFRYTDREIADARAFLADYPPDVISTRDPDTYRLIRDCCDHVYNGIDSAFFVPDVYSPFALEIDPFITFTFDRFPEPRIELSPEGTETGEADRSFEALGSRWSLDLPGLQMAFSRWGQWQAYIGALFDFRRLPEEIGSYTVIRPEHRCNPRLAWKIYNQPNGLTSDEPFTYFTLYGNTSLTLSDRVHACVVTLAYGNPAMLFTPSPRARLFERFGLDGIRERPVSLDMEMLEKEKNAEINFLRESVADIESG